MSQRWSPPNFRRLGSQRSSLLRDLSPESDDMFFSDLPSSSWNFPSRNSNFGSRFGDSVFNSFPRRSTMRSFPSHFDSASSHDPFESGWHQPSWVKDELRRSRGSSPSDSMHTPTPPGNNSRSGSVSPGINHQSFFSRQDSSIPIRVVHENSRQNSRASTPASATSDSSHSKSQFEMQEQTNYDASSPEPGLERHSGISAKTNAKQPYTAKRQPKVHHIPIYVEPRDSNPSTPPSNAYNSSSIPMNGPRENVEKANHEQVRNGSRIPSCPSPRMQKKPESQTPPQQSANPFKESQPGVERTIPIKTESKHSTESSSPHKKEKKTEIRAEASTPPPPPPAPPVAKVHLTPTEIIKLTIEAAEELRPKIDSFTGQRGDKQYLYLDEMLTRNLIKLDLIEAEGNAELRQNRRAAILKVNELIHSLESKVKSQEPESVATEDGPMEIGSDTKIESEKSNEAADAMVTTDVPMEASSSEVKNNSEETVVFRTNKSGEQKEDEKHTEQDEGKEEIKPMEADSSEIENSINFAEETVSSESSIPVVDSEPNPPDFVASNATSESPRETMPMDSSCTSEPNQQQSVTESENNLQLSEGQPTSESDIDKPTVITASETVADMPTEVEPKKFKSIMNVQVTDNSDLTLPPHGTVDVAAT